MARLEIEITRTAEKKLRGLPRRDLMRLVRAILALGDNPRPRGCRKLSGYDDIFRIRAGTYRVIYSVAESTLIVLVLKIGHRSDVYR